MGLNWLSDSKKPPFVFVCATTYDHVREHIEEVSNVTVNYDEGVGGMGVLARRLEARHCQCYWPPGRRVRSLFMAGFFNVGSRIRLAIVAEEMVDRDSGEDLRSR